MVTRADHGCTLFWPWPVLACSFSVRNVVYPASFLVSILRLACACHALVVRRSCVCPACVLRVSCTTCAATGSRKTNVEQILESCDATANTNEFRYEEIDRNMPNVLWVLTHVYASPL